jgi:O-antigen/teichoic acid export membrane protein
MSSHSLKGFLKGSFWVALAKIVTRLAGSIVLPILAWLLEPAALGLYSLVQRTVQTGDNLSRLGIDAAMHRNGAQYQTIGTEAVGRLFGVGACLITCTGGAIALTLWLFREAIALNWLGEPSVEPWLGLTAIFIVLTAIGSPSWFYLLALGAFRAHSLRISVATIAGTAATVALAWSFGLAGALWGLGVTALIQTIWGWWLTLPILREKGIQLRCDRFITEARGILSFGLPFYAGNFLSSFVALPLLGYVSQVGGIEQLGYLRVAQSLSQLISFLPTSIGPVLISNLSANLVADAEGYQQLKSLHLRSLWVFILIISVATCFSLEFLIPRLFGSSYTEAILLSRITIWITAVRSLSGMLSQYVISAGKTRIIAAIQTGGLIITVLSALVLIPRYSSLGLLLAQGLAAILILLAYVKPALGDLDVADNKSLWFLATLSFILVTVTFTFSTFINDIWLTLIYSVCTSITAAITSISVAFTASERTSGLRIIRKQINRFSIRNN